MTRQGKYLLLREMKGDISGTDLERKAALEQNSRSFQASDGGATCPVRRNSAQW